MAFNKVAVTRRNTTGWRRLFGHKRTMSNTRLLGTATSLFLGLSLIYSSIFYVPAFFNYQQAFGLTGMSPVSQAENKARVIQPYVDLLKLNRAFLRSGQGMEAVYSFPAGTKGELVFYQCQAPAIVEVFQCNASVVKRFSIGQKLSGKEGLRVNVPGFYGFDVQLEDPTTNFNLVWRRRY